VRTLVRVRSACSVSRGSSTGGAAGLDPRRRTAAYCTVAKPRASSPARDVVRVQVWGEWLLDGAVQDAAYYRSNDGSCGDCDAAEDEGLAPLRDYGACGLGAVSVTYPGHPEWDCG
jgi:hypothetical protein